MTIMRLGRLRRELDRLLAESEQRKADQAQLLVRLEEAVPAARSGEREWAAEWLRGRAAAYLLDARTAHPETAGKLRAVGHELEQLAIDLTHQVSA